MLRQLALAAVFLLAASPLTQAQADEVTIYRCIDAKGTLSLRDTPCDHGDKQQTRTMQRPKDAPPPPRPVAASNPGPDRAPLPLRRVTTYPPRPMYECTTPDGEQYNSDSDEGNPRWVPLWTLGYPLVPVFPGVHRGADLSMADRNGGISTTRHDGIGRPVLPLAAYGAGTWIRDSCYVLPQAETCDRLVDRRDEIRRRFFNAMPSERDVLRIEERGINARLGNDCGTY